MNPPDEILYLVRDWIWAPAAGCLAWLWRWLQSEIKDLRNYVDTQDTMIMDEVHRQRDIQAKIFDKLEEHAKSSAERHIELLKALHEGLNKKVDK
jgi:hypothetical protein